MESRRAFLGRCGAGAAVWTALGNGDWSRVSAAAAELDAGQLGELAAFAMERAKAAGASYADIRINRYRKPGRRLARPGRPRDGQAGRGAVGL